MSASFIRIRIFRSKAKSELSHCIPRISRYPQSVSNCNFGTWTSTGTARSAVHSTTTTIPTQSLSFSTSITSQQLYPEPPQLHVSKSMASHTESSNSTTSADKTNVASKSDPEASSPAVLPKLSAAEFRQYNSMAEHMEHFHNHFRLTWNEIYDTAAGTPTTNRKPLSARQLIETGLRFLAQLTLHHSVEETYIFPRLAERMPAFQDNDELKTHHKRIHEGMEALEAYLKACKSGERDLRMGEIKGLMDSWREVLWTHLDREVQELGAENMRRYWKVEEMKTLGF